MKERINIEYQSIIYYSLILFELLILIMRIENKLTINIERFIHKSIIYSKNLV